MSIKIIQADVLAAVQLINSNTGNRREWRITGEMYDYIARTLTDAEGLRGCFQVKPGEH